MSHMTSLVNAEKAVVKVRVFVRMAVVRPRKAHAPTGRGLRTRPAIVERKMESSCHASGVRVAGLGTTKRTRRPMARDKIKGIGLAPPGGGGVGGGGVGLVVDDDDDDDEVA